MKSIIGGVYRLETAEEVNQIIHSFGEWHSLLDEAHINTELGAETFILQDDSGKTVSVNQTRISKSKSSIWRPYANFHLAYTVIGQRRKGYAKTLLRIVHDYAVKNGCRRMKSLAASKEGLSLHLSVYHKFWGRTSNNEICIDTPLIECSVWDGRIPPSVIASKLVENFFDKETLWESVERIPLCFDKK